MVPVRKSVFSCFELTITLLLVQTFYCNSLDRSKIYVYVHSNCFVFHIKLFDTDFFSLSPPQSLCENFLRNASLLFFRFPRKTIKMNLSNTCKYIRKLAIMGDVDPQWDVLMGIGLSFNTNIYVQKGHRGGGGGWGYWGKLRW